MFPHLFLDLVVDHLDFSYLTMLPLKVQGRILAGSVGGPALLHVVWAASWVGLFT